MLSGFIRLGLATTFCMTGALGGCGAHGGPDPLDSQDGSTAGSDSFGPDTTVEEPKYAYRLFEATLDLSAQWLNPYDPAQIDVRAEFLGPDGNEYAVSGFVYQAFTRSLVNGREVMVPDGEPEWRVRFRPPYGSQPEGWYFGWRARVGNEVIAEGLGLPFEPEVDPRGHGLVKRSEYDSRYLAHEDGTSYFAVGENMAWYDGRGTFAYDDWMQRLAAQGGNYIRVWMPSWAFGLEWTAPVAGGETFTSNLGNYGARLDRAWKLDYVLDLAETLDIQVMLTLQNHGPFSTLHASEWDRNPYNVANGGPLRRPEDVFTSPQAIELFQRRFRYIVARWGHSPQVLAWELWNEFDLVTDADSPEAKAWTALMARYLRGIDPYGHLITTSMGGLELFIARFNEEIAELNQRFDFWDVPELDFTQAHYYGALGQPIDFSREIEVIMGHLRRFGKPMLAAEAGVNALGVAETRADDPAGLGFHDILWAGVFAESFGTGMSWWWDEINAPDNYDPQFGAVARFVAGVSFDREAFVRVAEDVPHGDQQVFVQALVGHDHTLVWLKDKGNQWFSPADTVVTGFALELPLTPDGPRWLSWMDPWGLEPTVVTQGTVTNGRLVVEVPDFNNDLALRVAAQPPQSAPLR